jgi:hypothetical protein
MNFNDSYSCQQRSFVAAGLGGLLNDVSDYFRATVNRIAIFWGCHPCYILKINCGDLYCCAF